MNSRDKIRGDIKKDLSKQLKGLGVFLETIEIKSLTIKNQGLFHDMQSRYRENTKRTADLYHMETENKLTRLKNESAQKLKEATDLQNLELDQFRQESNLKIQV